MDYYKQPQIIYKNEDFIFKGKPQIKNIRKGMFLKFWI